MKHAISITFFILMLTAIQTCIRIELQNAKADFFLPRRDLAIMHQYGNPKWRGVGDFTVKKTIEVDYRIKNNLLNDEPIPPAGLAEIERQFQRDVPPFREQNKLLSLVSSWGVWQYPITVVLGIGGLIMALCSELKKEQVFYALASVTGIVCLVDAMRLACFSSLGW